MKNRNYSIINQEEYEDVKKRYTENMEGLQVYARKIQKHPHIKKILFEKYNGICQFCFKPLQGTFTIHHANYDNFCEKPREIIELPNPTLKRPNRKIKVPNCEGCPKLPNCIKDLYPVHSMCNAIIDKIAKKRLFD